VVAVGEVVLEESVGSAGDLGIAKVGGPRATHCVHLTRVDEEEVHCDERLLALSAVVAHRLSDVRDDFSHGSSACRALVAAGFSPWIALFIVGHVEVSGSVLHCVCLHLRSDDEPVRCPFDIEGFWRRLLRRPWGELV
jgi:hypothetical protein